MGLDWTGLACRRQVAPKQRQQLPQDSFHSPHLLRQANPLTTDASCRTSARYCHVAGPTACPTACPTASLLPWHMLSSPLFPCCFAPFSLRFEPLCYNKPGSVGQDSRKGKCEAKGCQQYSTRVCDAGMHAAAAASRARPIKGHVPGAHTPANRISVGGPAGRGRGVA